MYCLLCVWPIVVVILLYACPLNLTFCSAPNILVVSKYYSRVTIKRLADLLCLSLQVCIIHCIFFVMPSAASCVKCPNT
jgi:hypothetical protein